MRVSRSFMLSLLAYLIYTTGCKPSQVKHSLPIAFSQAEFIDAAINDFIKNRHFDLSEDSVFQVMLTDVDEQVIAVAIIPEINQFYVKENEPADSTVFPTRFRTEEAGLFYWFDEEYKLSQPVIDALGYYQKIDTLRKGDVTNFAIHDDMKVVAYFFCKANPIIWEKVVTLFDHGYFEPPKVKCK